MKIIRSRNVVFIEEWKTERFTPSDIEKADEDPSHISGEKVEEAPSPLAGRELSTTPYTNFLFNRPQGLINLSLTVSFGSPKSRDLGANE